MKKALLAFAAVALVPGAHHAEARPVDWRFDNLDRIGGLKPRVVGNPRVVKTPQGKAVEFDGVDDAVYLDRHPLAGAGQFTIEAQFRPDGGAFEQRWMHLASDDNGDAAANQTRMLFEIRVVGNAWYLDAFVKGKGYSQVLIDPAKLHPVGRWYHVAQTFDGTTYRSYVDGVLEGEAKVDFRPQGTGRTSVGVRYNGVNFFHGAVRGARFTAKALAPSQFRLLRK
ncbi:MAG TPA: LamG domain-containing protein [Novosphingobium sp.]|nr:LamG domain-containing protein [Novosphingobium sp.]